MTTNEETIDMSQVNYPGAEKILPPKVMPPPPSGNNNKKGRIQHVYFDKSAETDQLDIPSMKPIRSKNYYALLAKEFKEQVTNYILTVGSSMYDSNDFRNDLATPWAEQDPPVKFVKLIYLQAIATLMTKIYGSVDPSLRQEISPFKALEKSPTSVVSYYIVLFSSIGKFTADNVEYSIRQPVGLLYDLAELFIAIERMHYGNTHLPFQNFIQQAVARISNLQAWDRIGLGVHTHDQTTRFAFVDYLRVNTQLNKFTFRGNFQHQVTHVKFDFDHYNNDFSVLNDYENLLRMCDTSADHPNAEERDHFANTVNQLRGQLRNFRAARPLGNGPLVDHTNQQIAFGQAYIRFYDVNEAYIGKSKSKFSFTKLSFLDSGERTALPVLELLEEQDETGNYDSLRVTSDFKDLTPTEIGMVAFHSMSYPLYDKLKYEVRLKITNGIDYTTVYHQMRRLTLKKSLK